MTVSAPASTAAAPSVRRAGPWAAAVLQILLCSALGMAFFLVSLGSVLEEFSDELPDGMAMMYLVDALLGAVAALAIGPLRLLPAGRLHTVVHLLLAAAVGGSVWALPASVIALHRLGRSRRPWAEVTAVLLVAGASAVALGLDSRIRQEPMGEVGITAVGVMAGLALVPLLMGHVAGTRRELLLTLRDRAVVAEREREAAQRARETAQRERTAAEREAAALVRERDAEAARVRAEERAALARDMHDSVSHHLAAIAMHAGAIAFRDDLSGPEVRSAATTVRDAAQRANQELRTVLTTLRAADGGTPLATAPTLGDIVERAREQGQAIRLRWDGLEPEQLDAHDRSTVVALARMLTELTANAAKHAPGAALEVTLGLEGATVVLRSRNPLPQVRPGATPSTGHGLLGLQERARLLGGDARYGERDESFEVDAWLPW